MKQAVYLYGVDTDAKTGLMWNKLRAMKGIEVKVVYCPPFATELYRMPFVKDERGERFFGEVGIQHFIDTRGQARALGSGVPSGE